MRRLFVIGLLSSTLTVACAQILGFEDGLLDPGEAGVLAEAAVADARAPDAEPEAEAAPECGAPLGTPDNCSACGHSCLGGACTDGACAPSLLAGGLVNSFAIAVDDRAIFVAEANQVRKIEKDGGASSLLATHAGGDLRDIASDGTTVYWAARQSGIYSCSASGCLDAGAASISPYDTTPEAVTLRGERVIYGDIVQGSIVSAMKPDGGTPSSLTPAGSAYAHSMATDISDVVANDAINHAVIRVSLDGGGVATLTTVPGELTGIALADGMVYFGIDKGALGVVAKSGGGATLFGAPTASAARLATDGTYLYWADQGTVDDAGAQRADGCIWRCRLASCATAAPTAVVCGQRGPYGIALDDRAVYWTNLGAGSPSAFRTDGEAWRIAKPPAGP